MKNRKKAFTLIELLVVIAIIALLLSIIVPSLKKAKEHARTLICTNNLKQYGIAGTIYRSDNDDKFPWVYWWLYIDPPAVAAADGTPLGCMWHNEDLEPNGQLWPYLDTGKVNLCPVFDSLARSGHAEFHVSCSVPMKPQFGYSMNCYLGGGMSEVGYNYPGGIVRASDLGRNPSQVAFFAEESLWVIPGINGWAFNDNVLYVKHFSAPVPGDNYLPFADSLGSFHKAGGDINSGMSNVVFVDSHVEMVAILDSLQVTWPHPGDWSVRE